MRFTILGLAVLFSSMACVFCQTVPYVSFMGTNLPNHSYVNFTLVGHRGSESVQCHTDLTTCCTADDGVDRGDWYFPSGRRLPFALRGRVFEHRENSRVELRRQENAPASSGIYRCDIETTVGIDNTRESVYVGLYTSGGRECRTVNEEVNVVGLVAFFCRRCVNT